MHSIDLSAPNVEVKPLHSSVLGEGHCFHVATSQGSKYISCTTSEERDKWLSSLRRTIRPGDEHSRRHDSSLRLWVVEAKNVTPKKSYYCTILLDRTLYAQTSVRTMADMLFWGEHFEFKNLPTVEIITINLFREPDRKKKKDKGAVPVGYISLSMKEMENNQLMEKWITCSSSVVGKGGKDGKTELPIIRLKARRQRVEIMPMDVYQDFLKYLTNEHCDLCQKLESLLAVREKEEFATSLVHILQTQSKAGDFLLAIIMEEIERLDDEHLTFRGNSIATKAMEAFMKLVGEKYLKDTLGEFIRLLIQSPEDCEVDPAKVAPQQLACQQKNLGMYCGLAWAKVINSYCYFPNEMRDVFANLRSRCTSMGKADYSNNLISGCIFLRFLCPAILSPSLFKLTQEYPQEKASRNLKLIAKTIQTLANFTQFGSKEEFMTFMNEFVESEEEHMKKFLLDISSQDAGNEFLTFDGHIDLGKELAVLHSLLLEYRKKYGQTLSDSFEHLNKILDKLSQAFDDPTVGQQKQARRSQIYDNLIHIPSPSKSMAPTTINEPVGGRGEQPTSPTGQLTDMIDMLNQYGGSMENLCTGGPERERSNSEANLTSNSSSRSRSASGDDEGEGRRRKQRGPAVGDVSVVSGQNRGGAYSQDRVNESWSQMVSAADNVNGDYIDLIPFMDEDTQTTSEVSNKATVSSNSQVVTPSRLAFTFQASSSSHSPHPPPNTVAAKSRSQHEVTRELIKSPVIRYEPFSQPLAFANPLFNHQRQKHMQPQPPEPCQLKPSVAPRPLRSTPALRQPPGSAPLDRRATTAQHRLTVGQAKTVRRPSSDSSDSSEDDRPAGVVTISSARAANVQTKVSRPQSFRPPTSSTNVAMAASADYQASIAPLKKLSQLSSSSSEDDGLGGAPRPGIRQNISANSSSKLLTSAVVSRPSATSNAPTISSSACGVAVRNQPPAPLASQFAQPPSTSSSSSSSSYYGSSGGYNGCSTFPRKHQRNAYRFDSTTANSNNAAGSSDPSPPLPPREALAASSTSSATPQSSSSSSSSSSFSSTSSSSFQRHSMFQRQFSHQQYGSTANQPPARQPPGANRLQGVTTNSAGYVQHRPQVSSSSSSNLRNSSLQKSSSTDSGSVGVGVATRPVPAAKPQNRNSSSQLDNRTSSNQFDNSGGHPSANANMNSGGRNSLTNVMTSSLQPVASNAFPSNTLNNNNNNSSNNNGSGPNLGAPSWQTARHMERSNSSLETSTSSSGSSESSPQQTHLLRSNQHNATSATATTTMHDSSSTHSISSTPGYTTTPSSASQPWANTPSHSNSSSSLSSLSRPTARKAPPPRSDSSGSLGNSAAVVVSRTAQQTPSGSNSSISSGNNNSNAGVKPLDNAPKLTRHRDSLTNPHPPPNSPNNSFATRLSSRSDSQIHRSSLQPQQPTHYHSSLSTASSSSSSKFGVASPTALSATSRSVSYHSPSDSPNVNNNRASYPASRSMDLTHLATHSAGDLSKRASADSTLSQPDSLSPTGSLSREDLAGGLSSSSSSSTAANRRLSPQSTVHMGISSVQRKLQEQERTKQEYEQEVHVLRQQLLEAQGRLQQTEIRLLDHESDTHSLMDEWQTRLVESEEKLRRQQAEKDEQMNDIVARLQTVEDELRREQEEMSSAVEHKQQVIEVQEKRIRALDHANQKLLLALADLKGKAARTAQMSGEELSSFNGLGGLGMEVAGFKTSSC